jgi:hypothetical protein
VKDLQRAEMTKELIRAQDALHNAFQVACQVNDLDLAADLRKRRKAISETITRVNAGPVKLSQTELLGSFR